MNTEGFNNFIMKSKLFTIGITLFYLQANAQSSSTIPRLVKNGNYVQLIVDNKPFLILGGELANSSASSNAYMRPIWPKLKQMNLNTVIAPVYWELIEPAEGQFNFSSVDSLIKNARLNKMKLVLLWFGVWKNSMSCYAPAWVKTNTENTYEFRVMGTTHTFFYNKATGTFTCISGTYCSELTR